MILCNECEARAHLNGQSLTRNPASGMVEVCEKCGRKRFCMEYEARPSHVVKAGGDEDAR